MRRLVRTLLLLACATFAATSASAQPAPYPERPVHVVVAYPAGGATDVIARAVSQRLGEMWGQPIVVENKGGAGTQIGAEFVAKAAPDGYTLLATADATFAFNPSLYRKLNYDVKDFVPVSGLGVVNQVLVASPAAPFKTVADLIAQAKAKPNEINYGTMGAGSSGHVNMAMFERMAGVALTPVHYRGGAPLVTDLLGGHVQTGFVSLTLVAGQVKAGRLKALGVGSATRSPQLPDVPSIAEAGLPGYDAVTWFGLFAPRATAPEIVAKVNADVQRVLAEPAFQERFLKPSFFEPIKGSPAEFAAFIDREAARWGKVIKDAKLSVE
jgi:tripartite-type tricarboxylate transporter receptor subunit TctC